MVKSDNDSSGSCTLSDSALLSVNVKLNLWLHDSNAFGNVVGAIALNVSAGTLGEGLLLENDNEVKRHMNEREHAVSSNIGEVINPNGNPLEFILQNSIISLHSFLLI